MSIATIQAGSLKKISLIVVAVAAIAAVGVFFALQQTTSPVSAAQPEDYGLTEGDRITSHNADGNPDINVINKNHIRSYARNFKNPTIGYMYGHYGVGGIFAPGLKQVPGAVRSAFPLSCYYMRGEMTGVEGNKVYYMESTGPDTGTLHHVAVDGAVAAAADPDFFLKLFRINESEFAFYTLGAAYTAMSQVPACTSGEGTATPPPMGNISVSLASDNPAAGTFVASQARADLAHFMFSGAGSVNSLQFKRIGVSADTDLSNVYLYDGARRLTDAATVANGMITFNDTAGLFTVAGSKNIAVKADLSASTGITIGVQLVNYNSNTTAISGNLHTVASGTLADVDVTETVDPAVNTALTPTSDVIAWRETVSIGTRYVWLNGLQLRVIGSVLPGDLSNYRLFLAGTQIGAVAQADSNGYIVFDFSGSPVKVETGSRELKVLVDVVGGSGRNFYVSLRQGADMQTTDSQYNQGIVATDTSEGSLLASGGTQTIASGTLTITKMNDSAAGDVIMSAAGVSVAKFEFKASGERMKVENLRAYFNESDPLVTELRNGALFADGVQIGSTQDILETGNGVGYTQYSLGSSLTVVPGTPRIVEIRADIADGDATDHMSADETITAGFVVGDSNVQRLTTLDYVNSTAKDGNELTVKTGSFTAGKYTGYANQSVVSPSTGIKIGHFTLTAASAENLNVNTINLDGDDSGGTYTLADNTEVYLKVWNDSGTLVHTTTPKATLSDSASNSYSVNFTLPMNKTYQVEVWGNVAASLTATHSMNTELDATAIGANSGTTATATGVDGQTITAQAGVLTTTNGSQEVDALRAGGTNVNTYTFTLQPAYDIFTLDEVYVDLSSTVASSVGAVAYLQLFEGTTPQNMVQIGSNTGVVSTTGSASFTGLNRTLDPAAGTKIYTVKAQLAQVGANANDSYGTVVVRLDGHKYRRSSGTAVTTTGLTPSSYTGEDNRVVAAYPTFLNVALDTTVLTTGNSQLFKTAITSNGGTVGLYRLGFDITKSVDVVFNGDDTLWKLYVDGVDVTALGTFASASSALTAGAAGTGYVGFTFTSEYAISGTKTFELYGTIDSITTAGVKSVTTKIGNHMTSASEPMTASTKAGTFGSTTASVVWTDQSTVSHSLTTADWFNDYIVKAINTGQTKQITL